jgi:hypothetical protein
MTRDPKARSAAVPPPHPPPPPPKSSFLRYLLAHLLTALLVFVVVTVVVDTRDPLPFGAVLLDYVTVHMPVPLLLSALLAWLLTRRLRPPFWVLPLVAVPFYVGALFVYEMGLLMASTQQ